MSTHEVITIQAGHYANFVGTHWWNMQEASFSYTRNDGRPLDINHDVLFREGLNPQKEVTYTPRLIAIDTKASLKSLKKEGTLYDAAEKVDEEVLWEGPTTVVEKENEEKNAFLKAIDEGYFHQPPASTSESRRVDSSAKYVPQNLDDIVNVWSDFLRPHLHPRSVFLIDEYYINGEESAFDTYGCGADAYCNKTVQEAIEDKVRQYVEECDYLQGFHVVTEGNNGFCAIGSCILQHLDDEYHKRTKITFPVFGKPNQHLPAKEVKTELLHQLYSTVLGFNNFNNLSSFFSPLSLSSELTSINGSHTSFPLLSYKPNLPYHTSAILAATLETVTAPYRLKARKFLISDIADNIVLYGRKVISSGICMPFPLQDGKYFPPALDSKLDCYTMTSVTPCFEPHLRNSLAQLAVLRGVTEKNFTSSLTSQPTDDTEALFGKYLNAYSPSALTFVSIFQEKCSVSPPFPSIINKSAKNNEDYHLSTGSNSTAIAATLSNSNTAHDMLESLLADAKKYINCAKVNSVVPQFEDDDFIEVIQNLMALNENYGPNYSV